jgi:hypothetical protein
MKSKLAMGGFAELPVSEAFWVLPRAFENAFSDDFSPVGFAHQICEVAAGGRSCRLRYHAVAG